MGAGLVATVAMSAAMLGLQRLGAGGRLAPKRVTEAALEEVGGGGLSESSRNVLAAAAHMGYGAALGPVFVLLRRRVRTPLPSILEGVAFGLLTWLVSYKGWVPAVGALPPPERDLTGRQVNLVLSHCVYGAVLGALTEKA